MEKNQKRKKKRRYYIPLRNEKDKCFLIVGLDRNLR